MWGDNMIKNYELVVDYIHKCYINDNFNPDEFEFYKLRKEKEKHRVGIYKDKENEYFFKIINCNDFNDEEIIKYKINPYFKIVHKYLYKKYDGIIINLYERVNTVEINSFNYLRDDNISIQEKSAALKTFFKNYVLLQKNSISLNKMNGDRLSDMWFHSRIKASGRAEIYYGKNFEKLLLEIKENYGEYYQKYYNFLSKIDSYLKEKNLLVEAYNHGDFHDFNFSLNGTFWDIETFGTNPIMNDFVIYYWHFYGREDGLIYKYSKWLVPYMHNKLNNKELIEVRNLKKDVIKYWYSFIEKTYSKYNIRENLNKEFIFKLFCRVFLIDNILNYNEEDRLKIVKYFYYFLDNCDKDIDKLLFSSKIHF